MCVCVREGLMTPASKIGVSNLQPSTEQPQSVTPSNQTVKSRKRGRPRKDSIVVK